METTVSWHLDGKGGSACGNTPAFATANGTVVGETNTPATPSSPLIELSLHDDDGCDSISFASSMPSLSTPGPVPGKGCDGSVQGGEGDTNEPRTASIVTPHTVSTPPRPSGAPCLGISMPTTRIGSSSSSGDAKDVATGDGASPESRAATAAAQASVAAVRKSAIRRRGIVPATARSNRASPEVGRAAGATTEAPTTSKILCSTPFVIRRPPSSGQHKSTMPAAGAVGKNTLGLGRPLHLSGDGGASGKALQAGKGSLSGISTGSAVHAAVGTTDGGDAVPDTPQGAGNVSRTVPLVTPTAEEDAPGGADDIPSDTSRERKARDASSAQTPASGIRGETEKEISGKFSVTDPPAAAAEGTAAVANPVPASPHAPTPPPAARKIVITFAAAGSLGMGLGVDETEEGSVVLGGKAPTSAAAAVPDGWRLTLVDGKCMRGLGGKWMGASIGEGNAGRWNRTAVPLFWRGAVGNRVRTTSIFFIGTRIWPTLFFLLRRFLTQPPEL